MSIDLRIQLSRGGFELDVSLQLPSKGVTALFGPSGSGKTTLLRCLAGLERLAGVELSVDGHSWQGPGVFRPVHQRALGYVFQEASLFPHLTVEKNLRFGFKRVAVNERQVDFDESVRLLGLQALLSRYPDQLSGGQRQRVAIARALLNSPRLMLMDEPMASLDADSKAEILPYLERLHGHLSIPVIYVSHAIEEVARLADHMVLLDRGRVQAQGSIQDVLTRTDLPLAHSSNASAIVNARVTTHSDDEMTELALADGKRLLISRQAVEPGRTVRARILARDVAIALQMPSQTSVSNCLPAQIAELSDDPHPGHVLLRLVLPDGQILLSRITRRSRDRLALTQGQPIIALVKAISLD
ncbi:MAG: molybdenum ABC transporter ATP-binding protein [Saccharospirillum sp.]